MSVGVVPDVSNRKLLRQEWLKSLKVNDKVRIIGWGGVPLGLGTVTGVKHELIILYPDGFLKCAFCKIHGVAKPHDNFDLIDLPEGEP